MAKVPEARKNAYEAAPEKLPSPTPDPLSEFGPDELDLISKNLAKMDQTALDEFYKSRGLSEDEIQGVQSAVDYFREQAPPAERQPVEAPVAAPVAPEAPQQGVNGLSPEQTRKMQEAAQGSFLTKSPTQLLTEYGPGLGRLAADIGVSSLAELPAMGVAAATAAIPVVGPFLAPITGFGMAVLSAESAEKAARKFFGMNDVKYTWWQTALAGLGPAMQGASKIAAFSRGAPKGITALSKTASEGAMAIRKGAMELAHEMGVANGLPGDLSRALALEVDQFMADKILYFTKTLKMDEVAAARAAFDLVPEQLQASKLLNETLGGVAVKSDGTAAFQSLIPETTGGVVGSSPAQKLSKINQVKAEENLRLSVSEAIDSARKSGVPVAEGLEISAREVKDSLGALIEESAPILLPKNKDGLKVGFNSQRGQFGLLDEAGTWMPFKDPESLKLIENAVNSDEYMRSLMTSWRKADQAFVAAEVAPAAKSSLPEGFMSSSGEIVKNAPPTPSAVASSTVDVTLSEIDKLKSILGSHINKAAQTPGEATAYKKAYAQLSAVEDKYMTLLENGDNIKVAQAVKDYRRASELSSLSATVLDPITASFNSNRSATARAFLNMSDENAIKFMRLKNEGVSIDPELPQLIAGQILQDEIQMGIFRNVDKMGGVSKETASKLPDIVKKITEDVNLDNKMNILLGKGEWSKMKIGIFSASKTAEKLNKLASLADNAVDPKIRERLIASLGSKAAELVSGGTAKGQFWVVKSIMDTLGSNALSKAMNQAIYTKYTKEIAQTVGNTAEAVAKRAEIIQSFGAESPLGLKVLADFDQYATQVLKQKRDYFRKTLAATVASKGLISGQVTGSEYFAIQKERDMSPEERQAQEQSMQTSPEDLQAQEEQ